MFADDIVDSETPLLKQIIEEHEKTNNMIIASKTYDYNELPEYGIIKCNNDNIIDYLQYKKDIKEQKGNIVHGRFILHTKIFDIKNKLIYHNNELQLPNAILLFKGEVRNYSYKGDYFNIGSKIGLIKANIHYGLKKAELSDKIKKFIQNI